MGDPATGKRLGDYAANIGTTGDDMYNSNNSPEVPNGPFRIGTSLTGVSFQKHHGRPEQYFAHRGQTLVPVGKFGMVGSHRGRHDCQHQRHASVGLLHLRRHELWVLEPAGRVELIRSRIVDQRPAIVVVRRKLAHGHLQFCVLRRQRQAHHSFGSRPLTLEYLASINDGHQIPDY